MITGRDIDPYPPPDEIPWAVVLRVPAFAAEHAAAHRSDHLSVRAGTTPSPPDSQPIPERSGLCCASPPATWPPTPTTIPSPAYRPSSTGAPTLYHRTDLDTWASAEGHIWDLPPRWQWTPDATPNRDGPNCTATLTHLVRSLYHSGQPAVLRLAAGEPDALSPVDLLVYPQTVDASASGDCLIYSPWNLPGCPTVRVPLRRIIAVSDAR